MKKLESIKKINIFSFLILLFSIILSNSFINLYYLSTLSPDFNRYGTYLSYFLEPDGEIFSEQGVLYYFIISLFTFINIKDFNLSEENSIKNLGNSENLNLLYVSDFEVSVSTAIQTGNLFLFIVGLFGLFKFLKMQNLENHKIYIVLSLLVFFPPSLQMRLTLKPEILGFALLPWALYYFISYTDKKSIFLFIKLLFIIPIIFTAKASITAMVGIFLLTLIYQYRDKISFKEIAVFILISSFIFSILYIENTNVINRSFFERDDLKQIYNQTEYNNVADPKIFYNINFRDLIKHPESHYHSDSIIGITLIDTFGDYFNEYWDKDYTLSKKYRKNFIQPSETYRFDSSNQIIYLKNWNFNLDYLRNITSLLLSVLFFILSIYFGVIKNASKILLFSPVIGILVLIINSLGFPEYNFYPETADTFKTFYYSFFLTLCFVELLRNLINTKFPFKKFLIFIYIFLICFVTGFPKENNTELDYALSNINKNTSSCFLNQAYLEYSLIERDGISCTKNINEVYQQKNFNIHHVPKINTTIFTIFIIFLITEIKFFNQYLKLKDIRLRKKFSIS